MARTLESKNLDRPRQNRPSRNRPSSRHLDKLLFEKAANKQGLYCIAGIDEAGRGSLAGPVVAAAVILKSKSFSAKIDDSKRLTPLQRNKAYPEILKKAHIGIGIITQRFIDSKNIALATSAAMEAAVSNLGKIPQLALVDGNLKLNLPCKINNIIKGDQKSLSIAAASIIAKVVRDNIISILGVMLYPEYKFDMHKGYGTYFHVQSIRKLGQTAFHRKTFDFSRGWNKKLD